MAKRKRKRKFTKAQLNTLYECWKDADNYKDRAALIEVRLPNIPILSALKKMRSLARTDSKWLRWATRKKNEKEKEKLAKKKAREKKKEEILKRRLAREERKRKEKEEKKGKGIREKIRSRLSTDHYEAIKKRADPQFFFCNGTHQYVYNVSCIFRIFSEQHEFSPGGPCDKCSRMDKYVPVLMEVIKDGGQKRTKPNKASKGRGKTQIKSPKVEETGARKAKNSKQR